MTPTENARNGDERPLSQDVLYALRYYLGNRRGLIALAIIATVAGLTLNWSWLAAIGIAPLLIAALPCLAMCALGLCMMRKAGGGSCASDEKSTTTTISTQMTGDVQLEAPRQVTPLGAEAAMRMHEVDRDADPIPVGGDDTIAPPGAKTVTISVASAKATEAAVFDDDTETTSERS